MHRLNYVCFPGGSGYAQAAQDMMQALDATGDYDIRIEYMIADKGLRQGVSEARYIKFKEWSDKPKDRDRTQVFHCTPMHQRKNRLNNRNLGFATFETFKPPSEGKMSWITMLNRNDAIIAPSKFNYHIFAHEKIDKPIYYIPHCYDTDIFNPSVTPLRQFDKFTFMFMGTWHFRKGWPQLLEAWWHEFDKNDPVQLLIKTDKIVKAKQDTDRLRHSMGFAKKDTAKIMFESKVFDEEDLPRFMKSVDCFICPTLGEGFGLPGLQCMALGVPVIITNFSGCQDYANADTATLLEPVGFQQIDCLDGRPQFKKKKWAFLSIQSIREAMRYVLENEEEVQAKAERGQRFVKDNFNYIKIAGMFGRMLGEVYSA